MKLIRRPIAALLTLLPILIVVSTFNAPTAYAKFEFLPPGSTLPTEESCAQRVRYHSWEPRPENYPENLTTGNAVGSITADPDNARPDFTERVNGGFTGTTDELVQFYACKWGWDEDYLRAVMVQESNWSQEQLGDFEPQSGGNCRPGYGDPCPTSFGITQVRTYFYPDTWPNARDSTPFNIDYYLANQRACYEGHTTWLNDPSRQYQGKTYGAGDAWGCIGWWFSGGTWWGPANQDYISKVQGRLAARVWVDWGWPGYETTPQPSVQPTATATSTTPPLTPSATATATTSTPTNDFIIFDDTVAGSYWEGSYSYRTKNVCDSSSRIYGSCSFSASFNAWGAYNFGKEYGFSTTGYQSVVFTLQPGSTPLANLTLELTAWPGGSVLGRVSLATANKVDLGNGWYEFTVPMLQLNPNNATAYTIKVANNSSNVTSVMRLDRLAFRTTAQTATPTPTSTATATTIPPTATPTNPAPVIITCNPGSSIYTTNLGNNKYEVGCR
jgi:hypothetical protein